MTYDEELIKMCKMILESKELQSKFNDFENNLELFSLNKNYKKHSYMVYFKKVIYDTILKKVDNEDYEIDDLIEYSKFLFEGDVENKPYLIEFNIVKEAINKLNEDICAFYNDDGRINTNREMLLKKRKILFDLSTQYEQYLCTLDYNESKVKNMLNNYYELMANNVNLSFEEVEELAYLYRSKIIDDDKCNKEILRYLFKNIIENHYNIDINIYRSLFYDMCLSLIKDNDVLAEFHYRTFVAEDTSGASGRLINQKGKYLISINIEEVTPKNYIYIFGTFFHELLHCKQYSGNTYETLIRIKEQFINLINSEEYKEKNYWNSSIERYTFSSEPEMTRKFLTDLAPKERYVISKKIEEITHQDREKLNKNNPNERIIDQKGRVKNINILFEEKVLRKRKFFRHFLSSCSDFSLLLHEYHMDGSKKNIIEILESRNKYMTSNSEEEKEYNERMLDLYNNILKEEDTLDYLIENIGIIYSSNSKYKEEAKNIILYKMSNWYFNTSEKNRDELLVSAISRIRNRVLKNFRNTNDLIEYLKKERELSIALNELPNILSEIGSKNCIISERGENRSL